MKKAFLLLTLCCAAHAVSAQDYVRNEVIVKFKSGEAVSVDGNQRMVAKRRAARQTLEAIGVGEAQPLMPLTARKEAEARRRKAAGVTLQREQLVPAWQTPPPSVDVSQLYVLKIDTTLTSVTEAIKQLEALDEVEYAEPNYIHKRKAPATTVLGDSVAETSNRTSKRKAASAEGIDYTSTEELFALQWNLRAIHMPELWEQPLIHQRRPVIAIYDSGVDTTHVDLKDNLLPGIDIRTGSSNVWDNSRNGRGHGTATASVAAAVGGNGGMVGANPLAQILPIKATSYVGSDAIQALDYALSQGADIISCSFGGNVYSQAESDAYQKAAESAIIVAAAGNDGMNLEETQGDFPVCYPGVIGVTCTDSVGMWSFSNFDPNGAFYAENENNYNYQLKAPGADVPVAMWGGGHMLWSGTSFSTPLVAGAISRLLQCRDYSSREELLHALVESQGTHFDAMEAYRYKEPLSGTFTRNICGQDITFRKTGENSLEVGDGTHPCLTGEHEVFAIPDVVAGYAVTSIAAGAFSGAKVRKFILPHMLEEVGSKAFAEAMADTLCLKGKAFTANCADDAFTPSQYASCVLSSTKLNTTAIASSPTWSQFQNIDTNIPRFTAQLNGIDVLFVVNDKQQKTVKVGNNSDEHAVAPTAEGTLVIPDEINGYKVTEVASSAFADCKGLTAITLPNSVTKVGSSAFRDCTSLASAVLPNQLQMIPNGTFRGCTSLTSIQWPENFWLMDYECLYGSGMEEIIVPDGVEEIEQFAFCTFFTKCVLPKSVEVLSHQSLASQVPYVLVTENSEPIPLMEVYDWEGEEYEDYIDAFGDLVSFSILVVPEGSKAAYEEAWGWNRFGSIVEGTAETDVQPSSYVYEKDNTVYALDPQTHEGMLYKIRHFAQTELTIPASVDDGEETYAITSVSGYVSELSELQTLTLPATLKSMGKGAFFLIPDLTTVISHIEEPFELDERIFSKNFFNDEYPQTLYVPAGTKEKYEALDVWNKFGEIIEIDVTGMESLDTQAQDIHSTHADEGWYTLQGVRLNSKPSTQGLFLHGERKVLILQ